MRKKFLTWLMLLICVTFIVTGVLAYVQFDKQAQGRAEQVLQTRLNDLIELINHTNDNLQHVVEINEESTLTLTRAMAEIIRHSPAILNDSAELSRVCYDLGAERLCITDAQGMVIAAVPNSLKGFNLHDDPENVDLLKCIDRPGAEILQRPRKIANTEALIQFAGVSRRDTNGIIQLGFSVPHEQAVRSNTTFAAYANKFKLGNNGHIIAFRGGALLNGDDLNYATSDLLSLPINATTRRELNDTDYYCYVIEKGDIRIIGLLPATEIQSISYDSIRQLFISNIWLFLVMFLLVWVLLQKLVLNGLNRINSSLRRISEGYQDERVNVRDTPEFTRLSAGINGMLDSLQSYIEHRRERLQRELALARSVQSTVMPNTFPAFPDQKAFDLYAARMQSDMVSGDFYDYFMADKDHLCFMLGDVSTSGMPGALFMMRAISVIRSLASAGKAPAELMTEANKILCENNVTKTKISFFLARLNINSGVLRFVNAGPPQALRSTNNEPFTILPMRSGTVLGIHNKSVYKECIIQLQPGDKLLLYSQGVLKVTDSSNIPFGNSRLQQALQTSAENVTDLIRSIQVALRRHTGNKEQAIDSTLLGIDFKGKWLCRKNESITAGHAMQLADLMLTFTSALESVLASPVAIAELNNSISDIISALPQECNVNLTLCCNEEEAKVVINYHCTPINPLTLLPNVPIDRSDFTSDDTNGSTLTLWKSLA